MFLVEEHLNISPNPAQQPHNAKWHMKVGQKSGWFIAVKMTQRVSLNTHRSLAVDELRDMVFGERSKSESER